MKLLKQMNNEFIVKLLDDVSFTGPNGVPYRGLILEYLSGGDLGQFLANMKKDRNIFFFFLRSVIKF